MRMLTRTVLVVLALALMGGRGEAKGRKGVIVDNFVPRLLTDLAAMVGTWDGVDPDSNRLFRIEVQRDGQAFLVSREEGHLYVATLEKSSFARGRMHLEFRHTLRKPGDARIRVVGEANAAKVPSEYGEFFAKITFTSDLLPTGTSWSIRFVRISSDQTYFGYVGASDGKMREAVARSREGSAEK